MVFIIIPIIISLILKYQIFVQITILIRTRKNYRRFTVNITIFDYPDFYVDNNMYL